MATSKSTLITNRDAVPSVHTDGFIHMGKMTSSYGYVFTGASDAAGTNYKLVSVPSNARLVALEQLNTTLGNSSVIDVTTWYPTQIPSGGGNFLAQSLAGSIIGSSNFKTAILGDSLASTPTSLLSVATAAMGVNYQEMPLWQILGLASDPEVPIDIGFSVRVAVATAGYIGMRAMFQF